jgi:heptosyltransferase-1
VSDRHTRIGNELSGRAFQRILLIKPSSLGDVIHALPVLHGLRKRYPESTIDWLIATPFAPLVENHPDLNETILFDRRRFGRISRNPRAAMEFLRFTRELRCRRYDLTIDLQGLFRSGFLSWASRAPVRLGFRAAREGARVFYTHQIPVSDPDAHAVDKNFLVGAFLGFGDQPVEFNLGVDAKARDEVSRILESHSVNESGPLLVVAPGARWETKRWNPARFAETIDRFVSETGGRCVVVGGPDEVELCQPVASLGGSRPVDLSGSSTLPQLTALVARADVVLCHDSAVAHLAVALNRRVVCLTGPTNPRRTGPYGQLEAVLRLDLSCSPCYFRRLSQCRHNQRCMAELSVPVVVAKVRKALEATAKFGR